MDAAGTLLDAKRLYASVCSWIWRAACPKLWRASNCSSDKQLRARGKTHLEASFAARDLMDFQSMGPWGAVRLHAQTVPGVTR